MSKRVYKEAFSYEKTAQIISEGSGKLFDPKLVELLLTNGEQFQEIFQNNPDEE
jgi:putative two-component system response regulator